MDHQVALVGELKPNDLQQIAGVVRSNREDLGWVGFGFEVDDGEGMIEGVEDCGIRDSVLVRQSVDLHTHNIVIRNSGEWDQCAWLSAVRDGCPLLLVQLLARLLFGLVGSVSAGFLRVACNRVGVC